MMRRSKTAIPSPHRRDPFAADTIRAHVEIAHRMRSEAMGGFLVALWRLVAGRRPAPVAVPADTPEASAKA